MDFDLFMERYGYKLLFLLFGLVLAGILSVLGLAVYSMLKLFGYVGAIVLVMYMTYAFLVQRRVLDASAEAHGKYFYDPKQGKRP